ncbi:FAD-dependent oxidoreductase [Streptomyces sp. NPDC006879]|uniref:FAD-dependent oxidoreductase n=1 Tax=Streptomyces sp. NPDC006879 TaxID=3364767 RepID=UPI0036B6260F
MTPERALTVVGHGPIAHTLVEALIRYGHRGPVTVFGARGTPAHEPALLPAVLDAGLTPEALHLPPLPSAVQVHSGTEVLAIDRRRRLLHTSSGQTHAYQTLVLATGVQSKDPGIEAVPGPEATPPPGVRYLRTPADHRAVAAAEGPVVVAGGGLHGVGTAVALRAVGHEVTLVHPGPRPAHRELDARAGAVLAGALRQQGITLELGHRVSAHQPGKAVLDDGRLLAAGLLLVCAGHRAHVDLARRAGLALRGGAVRVDGRLRTCDPHVYAVGGCTADPARDRAEDLAAVLTGRRALSRPARRVLRPRVPGLDLTVLGEPVPEESGEHGEAEDVEVLTLTGPARHAHLRLREGRLHGGVLIGLPKAAADLTRAYVEDRPLPSDRLALLLGRPSQYAGRGALPLDAVLCQCNHVTKAALAGAWQSGARDLPALAAATRVTTGCGSCSAVVARLCAEWTEDRSEGKT